VKAPDTYIPFGLFAVALVARLAAVSLGVVFTNDSPEYLRQAQAIAAGGLALGFPNGYPLLIAPLAALFAGDGLGWALGVLNAALSAAVAPLAFVMMRCIGVSTVLATIGALAVALWPHQLNYARQVLSEAPTTFWLALSCAAVLLWRPAVAGATLAAAVMTRPSYVLCTPLIAAALHGSGRGREAGTFSLTVALILVAYAAMQWTFTGVFGLSGNLAVNIVVSARWDPFVPDFHITPPASLADALRIYFDVLVNDPARFFVTRLFNLWDLFGPWPLEEVRSPLSRVLIGLRFPVFALYVVGLARLARYRKWVELTALAAPVGAVAMVHVPLFAIPRFAVPVEPFLIVGGTIGLRAIIAARQRVVMF